MKRWLVLVSMALVLAGCAPAATEAPPAPAAAVDEEPAVRAAAAAFYAALNTMFTGDVAPMIEVWSHAEDVTYMGPAGGVRVGWAAVLQDWEAQAAMMLGGSVTPENMHVVVGGDLAVMVNVENGENVDAEGNPLVVSIRATNVFRKEAGAWKMIGHHTDLLPYLKE